ncbi:MAG: 2-oxoacid:acceptor oxidoreductase family protein, partial [Gammaproteobacteria bacterium]|nr:2-oxoacid:acceptor oxidoreductase family protein [Gammaproteobacteria bacterium]
QTGLAQKGGAVISHLRIATDPGSITSTRIANGGANLVIGCDLLVTGARDTLATMDMGRTRVVANGHRVMTGLFTRTPNLSFPSEEMHQRIEAACGSVAVDYVEATRIATALMGDSIATNLFMLGFAYQKGLVPLHARSIERAIELNGVAIDMNKQAFTWGRQAGADLARVQRALTPNVAVMPPRRPDSVDDVLAHRGRLLEAYQDAAYAERYRRRVEQVREAEARACPGQSGLAMAVARNLAGLMAYKDEYEVARLYSEPAFRESIEQAFEGDYRLTLHLAPPLLARRDPNTGEPRKSEYGEWMLAVLARLARFKRLRGSWLDPFGWTAERRRERALVREYEQLLERLCAGLNTHNHALAVEIASMPEEIRGFGHIKLQSIEQASQRREQLLDRFERGESASVAA